MRLFVAALWLTAAVSVGAESVWKLSDPLGTDRGPAPLAPKGSGWILRVDRQGLSETRTLFEDGKEDSVRLLDLDSGGRVVRWQDWRKGVAIWEVTLDPVTGLPLTETVFQDHQPTEVSTLEFRDRVLVRRTVRDAAGALLFEDRLYRWPDGSLRRLERDGPDGPLAEASWSYGPGGTLSSTWSADEEARGRNEHLQRLYTPGRVEEVLANETAVLVSRITEALDSGASRETRLDTASDRQEVRVTDPQGRLTEETMTRKGVVLQTRRWSYDAQSRVVEFTVESAGPVETWTYRYEGSQVLAVLSRDGQVVQEETSRDGEKASVRYYDRGDLFLEETWSGGRKTKETYLDQGTVVRERSF